MKNRPYANFWLDIHRSSKTKGFPLRVMFELTYRCNFKCKHCYVPPGYRKKSELNTEEVFSILGQLKEMGCFYLGFTGGEPFIRKDIIDILRFAKEKGFELIIYTNGALINAGIAKELQRLRPNKVDITIPAMSKQAFERISGIAGSHRKVFKAIDLLHKKQVRLGFKTCVLKENASEIKNIQAFAHSLDALYRLDDTLSPRLDGSREPYKYRGVLNADYRENNIPPRECFNDEFSINLRAISKKTRLFKCGVGTNQAAITPQGELKVCLMIGYPKYKISDNLKERWESLRKIVSAIKPDENYQCNRCKLYAYCNWCPAMGWLYRKSFTLCAPENRKQAFNRSQQSQAPSNSTV